MNEEKYLIVQEDEEEFIGQIIDTFEDFLDDKCIIIENEERDADEDLDAEMSANIYGTDYDYIADELKKVFRHWNIIRP